MIVYLVRHARAGRRTDWAGDDGLRPLDARGRRQADGLVTQLAGWELGRIVSSPAVRCVETVVPLADARRLTVEVEDALVEGADSGRALELFGAATEPLAASVHGDLVEALLGTKLKKGATAVLEVSTSGVDVLERFDPAA
jgi:phosphohistidine phosphatase SixA